MFDTLITLRYNQNEMFSRQRARIVFHCMALQPTASSMAMSSLSLRAIAITLFVSYVAYWYIGRRKQKQVLLTTLYSFELPNTRM